MNRTASTASAGPGEGRASSRKRGHIAQKLSSFSTGISSLDLLLGGGVQYLESKGCFGVVFGAAGSGKSILSIQMCCGYVWGEGARPKRAAIYLTQEAPELIRKKMKQFGYFRRDRNGPKCLHVEWTEPAPARQANCFTVTSDWAKDLFKESGVYVFHVPLSSPLQIDKLVNIFDVVTRKLTAYRDRLREKPRKPKLERTPLLVCIDNAETLCKEAYLEVFGVPRQDGPNKTVALVQDGARAHLAPIQDRNFYKLLRAHLAEQSINSFFAFEEPTTLGQPLDTSDVSTTAQAYAADLVIHLGHRILPNGYRERVLEIVKAKNQFYRLGKHHFSIVPPEREDPHGTGLVVYPSLATQLHLIRFPPRGQRKPVPSGGGPLGIATLDVKLRETFQPGSGGHFIQNGSTSVLVSDLDEKATEIALHFALAKCKRRPKIKSEGELTPPCLYLSFGQTQTDLERAGVRFSELGKLKGRFGESGAKECQVCYVPPEHISESKLLRDIDLLLRCRDRVVVDNIFAFQAKFPLIANVEHFLAALLALFKARGVASLIVDTVEVGEGRNPIEQSKVAGLADNVFLLRHIEFHSRPRSVFSILKLQGRPTPERIWELRENTKPNSLSKLEAEDTFQFHGDVLSGRPTPVRISMGLFRDDPDSPLHQYLLAQQKALEQTLGEAIDIKLYGAEEYGLMQRTILSSQARPLADCHIVAIDEFWLGQLIRGRLLEELGPFLRKKGEDFFDLAERSQYVTAAHDVALWSSLNPAARRDKQNHEVRYAVPVRHNCGILCSIPEKAKAFFDFVATSQSVPVDLRAEVRKWLECRKSRSTETPLSWASLVELRKKWARWPARRLGRGDAEVFFTFCMDLMESCVSFLLELALSTVPAAELFDDRVGDKWEVGRRLKIRAFAEPVRILLGLLDKKDLHWLAEGRFRKAKDEPRALFTRQWWSTLGCLRAREENEIEQFETWRRREDLRARANASIPRSKSVQAGAPPADDSSQSEPRWFLQLEPLELPKSLGNGAPTPVSGTWYLGILRGSVAVPQGVRVIGQFCSIADDEQKLRQYIGLPVRRLFFEARAGSFRLPYAKQFAEVAKAQTTIVENKKVSTAYVDKVLNGTCPFHRIRIAHYDRVAPLLWRMMSAAAKGALAERPPKDLPKRIVKEAAAQWNAVEKAIKRRGQRT